MIPIAVFASGRGSNFDSIQKAILKKELSAEVCAVFSDKTDAPVLGRAKEYGIEGCAIPPSHQKDVPIAQRRRQHEEQILEKLRKWSPHFIVMAGYMRIITPLLIEAFRSDRGYSRIVNIHPSLLPAFPGLDAYSQAFRYGTQVAGATVHLVEAGVDSGPICAQESFSIADCRSEWEVEQRGLAVEHHLYPKTLQWVLREKFTLEERSKGRLCVCPN